MIQDGLSVIYARSNNHCIGLNGQLPWHLPDEYAHFDQTTIGYPNIMGRRSFEDHNGALPNRLNLVVSASMPLSKSGQIWVARNLTDAINMAKQQSERYFVIGGARLITEAMPITQTVIETIVDTEIEGDTFLPQFDFSAWRSTLLNEHPADAQHAHGFQVYRRERVS